MKILNAICIAILLSHTISFAQNDSSDVLPYNNIDPVRLGFVIGGAAGLIVFSHLQNYNSWWKGNLGPFHRSTGLDDGYSFGADKCGHFLFSYYTADAVGNSLRWAGFDEHRAFWYSGILAFTFQIYVEVEDGFHPELGFSIGDAVADGMGSFFPVLQSKYDWAKTISTKWSAIPSSNLKNHRTIIDDYESQYYWLSFNIHDLLGESSPSFIPSFFNVAIGYGVTNLDLKGNGERELYLSLDCDINKLPGEGDFLSSVKHVLNYFHFPAPTIRLFPSVIMYGIRF